MQTLYYEGRRQATGYEVGQATTSTPTFIGYHGTSSVHVPAIRAGIRPPTGQNFSGDAQLGEGFYTTMDYTVAEGFALNAVVFAGGAPVILPVYVADFGRLSGAIVPARFWWQVPRHYITDFDYLTAPIDGLEPVEQTKLNPRAYGAIQVR
jgi:hypothetical protein